MAKTIKHRFEYNIGDVVFHFWANKVQEAKIVGRDLSYRELKSRSSEENLITVEETYTLNSGERNYSTDMKLYNSKEELIESL